MDTPNYYVPMQWLSFPKKQEIFSILFTFPVLDLKNCTKKDQIKTKKYGNIMQWP